MMHSLKTEQQQGHSNAQSGPYKFNQYKTHRSSKNKGYGAKGAAAGYGSQAVGGAKGGYGAKAGGGMLLPSKKKSGGSKAGNFSVRSPHGLAKPSGQGGVSARSNAKYLSPYSQKAMQTGR